MAKTSADTSVWDRLRFCHTKIADARRRLAEADTTLINPASFELLSLDCKDAADAALEISQILRKLEKA